MMNIETKLLFFLTLLIVILLFSIKLINIKHAFTGSNEEPKFTRLEEYKSKLLNFIRNKTNIPLRTLEGLFIKWIFIANKNGKLDDDLVPTENIIINDDIRFVCDKSHQKPGTQKPHYQSLTYQPDVTNKDRGDVLLNTTYENLTFTNGDKSYSISHRQYNRLKQVYTGTDFNNDVFRLLHTYNILGGLNNLASFPLDMLSSTLDSNYTELFGSPLNTQYKYCSAFEFEKRLFSSLGSFFNYTITDGKYIANPPFDSILMKDMAIRLIDQLDSTYKISIVIILPVWDPASQIKLNITNYNEEFEAYEILKNSKYFRKHMLLDKYKYKFYDYITDSYKPLSYSHLILFENYDSGVSLDEISNKWERITKHS